MRTSSIFSGALALWLMLAAGAAAQALRVTGAEPGRPGGRLVVALRAEPKTFNPAFAVDNPSLTVVRRITADLVHVDRHSHETEPALARRWTVSPDGRRFELELRRGVRFSDGHPLDADDVVFSFRVYLDPELASPYRDLLTIDGAPIAVRKLDGHRLEFTLPRPAAVAERLFDSVAILPAHRLEPLYRAGRLGEAWSLATPPGEIAGLGAFRLTRYVPGERLELERNPHYWKVDARGRRLPYLDAVTFLFVPDESAQAIRFQAGETDVVDRLSAESFALLEDEREERGYELYDLGPDLLYQFLFFNLNDLAGRELPAIERKQTWFRDRDFRRAVSAAIDRRAIVRLVYRGRAAALASHVSPGFKTWWNPALEPPRQDLDAARRLLRAAGFVRDADGALRDPAGAPVAFTIATNAGNRERVQIATLIEHDLAALGMRVRIAELEFRSLLARIYTSYDYDAAILGLGAGDADPNPASGVLGSDGASRLWRLRSATPEPPWQQEIDRLMRRQASTLDPALRRRHYHRVQALVAENLPLIPLVSPHVLVGARRGLGNFRPAVLEHQTLWNADRLFWRRAGG